MADLNKNFFRLNKLTHIILLSADSKEAVIEQSIELEAERAGVVFISQHLDDIEMYEAARFLVEKGSNRILLKNMRIIRPRFVNPEGEPVTYKMGIAAFAAGGDLLELFENNSVKS